MEDRMLEKLLVTGAAGGVATQLRPLFADFAKTVRLSDVVAVDDVKETEEFFDCDLADEKAVFELVAGCDGIVHLGGISVEKPYSLIRAANLDGVYHLYEAVRQNGNPRIIFASSNHVVGYYRQDEHLDHTAIPKPDGLYGVSKCFGEAMASLYHDKFGVETAIVRIGSCFPEPADRRMLSTWLSAQDFARMIKRCMLAPRLGCPVIYGISDNETVWWSNEGTRYLGWRPQDSSEKFRDKVEAAAPPPGPEEPVAKYQGGVFTTHPIFKDED